MKMDSRSETRLPNIVKIVDELQKNVEKIDKGGEGGLEYTLGTAKQPVGSVHVELGVGGTRLCTTLG